MILNAISQTIQKQKSEQSQKYGVKVNIYGTTGSGKTYQAQRIIEKCFSKPLIYRMTDDFDKMSKVAVFKPKNYIHDLEPFIQRSIQLAKKNIIDCIVFDEADLLFPSNKPPSDIIKDLFDRHRHYGLSLLIITRRPQNIHTLVSEEAHFISCLSIEGENAYRKLNAVYKGWGEMVRNLQYKSYKYVFKQLGYDPVECDPI